MAFKMPHPVTRPSGVFHLNVRVPSDLVKVVPGTTISLPLEDATVRIKATDKVVLSLRTKDVASAKSRFTIAYGALCRHFEAVRAGPVTLSHKLIVALAGEFYRKRSARLEVEYDPDRAAEDRWRRQDAIDEWRYGDGDGLGEIALYIAEFYAAMQRPSGPYLFAFEHQADFESDIASVTYAEALEHLFGSDADALCAELQLVVNEGTRKRLLAHIGEVIRLAADRVTSTLKGDFSPDPNLARFSRLRRSGRCGDSHGSRDCEGRHGRGAVRALEGVQRRPRRALNHPALRPFDRQPRVIGAHWVVRVEC